MTILSTRPVPVPVVGRTPGRPGRRRPAAAAAVCSLAVGLLAVACQGDSTISVACDGRDPFPLPVQSVAPNEAKPGELVSNRITLPRLGPGSGSRSGFVANTTYHLWLPDEVQSLQKLTFDPGAYTGTYRVEGREVIVSFAAAPHEPFNEPLNPFTMVVRVDAAAPGGTMRWPAPVAVDFDVQFTPLLHCLVPLDAPPMNVTHIVGPPNPAWVPHAQPVRTTTTTTTTVPPTTAPAGYDLTVPLHGDIHDRVTVWVKARPVPATVHAGDEVKLTLGFRFAPVAGDVALDASAVDLPLPAGISDVSGVQPSVPGTPGVMWYLSGRSMSITFGAGTARLSTPPPEVEITARVAPDARPGSIVWPMFPHYDLVLSGVDLSQPNHGAPFETLTPVAPVPPLATWTVV